MSAAQGADDTRRTFATVVAFGFALGGSAVVLPLLALDRGIAAPIVGLLTAMSGAAQLTSRFALPWLLERVSDRTLLMASSVSLAASAAVLLADTSLPAFVGAQVLNGVGRALFWTSSQTHMVRGAGIAIRRLAQGQLAGNVGTLAGPALAGSLLALSAPLALGVIAVTAAAAVLGAASLVRWPPYERRPRAGGRGRLWRRRPIALGCWTSFSAGGWTGILDSFVPIVLTAAGLGAASVGWLVAVASAAGVAATALLARYGQERHGPLARLTATLVLIGAGGLPFVAHQPVLAGLALAAAGAGGGLASSLGPAIVNANVEARQQGTAIALAGTYRAASRLATPSVMAAAGGVVGIPVALGIAAVGIVAPTFVLSRGSKR